MLFNQISLAVLKPYLTSLERNLNKYDKTGRIVGCL